SEPLNLANPDIRWNLARTMFHHEAGILFSDITRETFNNSIRLADDVIAGGHIDLAHYMTGEVPIPTSTLDRRVRELERQNAELTRISGDLKRRLEQIKAVVEQPN